MEGRGDVALGRLAGGNDIFLGAAPPDTNDVIPWEADAGGLTQRHRAGHAPVSIDHVVGLDLADLQPQ